MIVKKTHLLRLESVVPHGVGGKEAGTIDLIYSFLLQRFELDVYNHIQINQIGNELEEFILKEGKNIHINIRYPAYLDFESKSLLERNKIRLDVVHSALTRIAEHEDKLDISMLVSIKQMIIENNFSFDFEYSSYVNRFNEALVGKVYIHPEADHFNFYAVIEEKGVIKYRPLIYQGLPLDSYIVNFFSYGKWVNSNKFVISGKETKTEIHILVDTYTVNYKNKSGAATDPYFEMMRSGLSANEKKRVHDDWLHSLPPDQTGAVSYEPN